VGEILLFHVVSMGEVRGKVDDAVAKRAAKDEVTEMGEEP
jgi:hypothetical protein